MSVARIAVLILAVLAAAAAAWLASSFVGQDPVQVAEPQPQLETTEVLVAARDMAIGQRISAGDLKWQTWPRSALTPVYVTRTGKPEAMDDMRGSLVRSPLLSGEPVTPSKVIDADGAGFMSARLGDGMRAISVSISPETGAGGFILPGDRVDVILTRRYVDDAARREEFISDTILTNVRVLAIDQTYAEDAESGGKVVVGKTATLELTPQQAETLARAQAAGEIWLTLRSLSDTATGGPSDTGAISGRREAPMSSRSVTVVRYGVPNQERTRLNR